MARGLAFPNKHSKFGPVGSATQIGFGVKEKANQIDALPFRALPLRRLAQRICQAIAARLYKGLLGGPKAREGLAEKSEARGWVD